MHSDQQENCSTTDNKIKHVLYLQAKNVAYFSVMSEESGWRATAASNLVKTCHGWVIHYLLRPTSSCSIRVRKYIFIMNGVIHRDATQVCR